MRTQEAESFEKNDAKAKPIAVLAKEARQAPQAMRPPARAN
jgi:hypothetical protein